MKHLKEAEILVPVTCPICLRESLAGFRMSVVLDALQAGQIRLYASCHVAGWEASKAELEQIRDYLDAGNSAEHENLAFVHTGMFDEIPIDAASPSARADETNAARKLR
ncbi:MAG TPA: hypothetical protein VKG63_19200 [Steroidobacteraceae bacterium]|nr:hypothetical protein [Steroidobacteraceae bacterium]